MLKIDNLCISYGEMEALHAVCLQVNRGEVVSIVGSNGAGKTNLLRSISGLLWVSSGRIPFLDVDITSMRPDRIVSMGLCQVPEGRHLFPTLSIYDNLGMGAYLRIRGRSRAEFEKALHFVFKLFPILEKRKREKGGHSVEERNRCWPWPVP